VTAIANLPPLTAIRAFEAAARHLSFTRAAEELGMTQAAVSYQIKLLEERIGAPLFLRKPRQVALSEAGARLYPQVNRAFELMREAFAEMRTTNDATLTISAVPTFTAQWLVRHLGTFQLGHPQLAVRLDVSQTVVDFAAEEVDVGIRAGTGPWPGLVQHELVRARFAPMLGPALAGRNGALTQPADLLELPLIDPDDPWWPIWLQRAGVSRYDLESRPQSRLGAQTYEAQAAMAGQGVALLTPALYRQEVAEGKLVQPFDILGDEGALAYWLVYAEARRNVPKIKAFREWIIAATVDLRG
jgi:LysR family glycine cleavage system transcriptional activator